MVSPRRHAASLRNMIRRLLSKNAHAARWLYLRYLHQETTRHARPPLLVYQMGKVGSKSVRDSLRALGIERRVFHVHFLSPERVREMEKSRRVYLGTRKVHLLQHVWQYMYINEQLRRDSSAERWKVITLTREPVGRNLSTFFENLDVERLDGDAFRLQSDYYGFDVVVDSSDLTEISRLFFERLRHESPLVFFDDELKRNLDLDVYATRFDPDKGYEIYQAPMADVLLMRLESLNHCAPRAFREFLGLEDFRLINTNVGSEKPYAPLYEKAKKEMLFPRSYLDRMYDSKYARHFYSAEELIGFRKRWRETDN
jgi:hypothetical protein